MNLYSSFDEVEKDINDKTPRIIYKFRNWENEFHKKILTEREVWFAHPHSLNDPHDLRPPYNFIVENIDWDRAKFEMKEAGRIIDSHLSEEDLDQEVENRLNDLKKDPIDYFLRNLKDFYSDTAYFDSIGVFSCCTSFSNEAMWANYGNDHRGFALGFNTIELARPLNCGLCLVNYDDKPIDYQIFGSREDNLDRMNTEIYQKSTKWRYEEEIRFFTYGIGINRNRSSIFPVEALEEIIFGLYTSTSVIDEIIKIVSVTYPKVSLFKVAVNPTGIGLIKTSLI